MSDTEYHSTANIRQAMLDQRAFLIGDIYGSKPKLFRAWSKEQGKSGALPLAMFVGGVGVAVMATFSGAVPLILLGAGAAVTGLIVGTRQYNELHEGYQAYLSNFVQNIREANLGVARQQTISPEPLVQAQPQTTLAKQSPVVSHAEKISAEKAEKNSSAALG